MGESFIIKHNIGPLYPIPQSTKSPQISSYQSGLQQCSTRIFHKATALAQWYEDLIAQALLINMHEYFSGQVIFQLHPACDAMFYMPKFFYFSSISNASDGGKHQIFGIYITVKFGGSFSKMTNIPLTRKETTGGG